MERLPVTWIESTRCDGFVFGTLTPLGADPSRGMGVLEGPDGSRAALEWVVSPDGPYIMRLAKPAERDWGSYRVGFSKPVRTAAELQENLAELMPKLRVLYRRLRVQ